MTLYISNVKFVCDRINYLWTTFLVFQLLRPKFRLFDGMDVEDSEVVLLVKFLIRDLMNMTKYYINKHFIVNANIIYIHYFTD